MNAATSGRLAFIDVVRGIAAVAVLVAHTGEISGLFSIGGFGAQWFNAGEFGVVAFFLVSGFVIPFSAETSRSLKAFWVRRIFRLYPLYLLILLLVVILGYCGLAPWSQQLPATGLIKTLSIHLFFLQQYTSTPDLVANSWTLALEMVWYGLFTLMLLLGFARRPVFIVVISVLGLFLLDIFSLNSGIRLPAGRFGMIETCLAGLLIYRHFNGELGGKLLLCLLLLCLSVIAFSLWVAFEHFTSGAGIAYRCVFFSWGGAYAFVLGCYWLKHSQVMQFQPILGLGRDSYSIYMVHPVIGLLLFGAGLRGVPLAVTMVLLTLAVSVMTYRYIEEPGVNMGRGLARRFTVKPLVV